MAFAGVSLIVDGQLCDSTSSPFDAAADSGYHLFVVQGAGELLDGHRELEDGVHLDGDLELEDEVNLDMGMVRSRRFIIGGHPWRLHFYPCDGDGGDFISVYLTHDQPESVEARFVFSFVDQPELRGSMGSRQSQTFASFRCHGCDPFTRRHVLERSKHMKNDSFTIRCDVAVVKNIEEQGVGSMENHFGNPLLSMECSDITFEVGGKEFAAHRCVLAARSAVFKAQLVGAMDEGATAPSVIKINGIDADVFERLLTFIYTGAISEFKKYANEETARLLELLEAADRYELHSLKSICEEILASRYIHPPTVSDILDVAEDTRCPWLKDECVEFIKSTELPSFLKGLLKKFA